MSTYACLRITTTSIAARRLRFRWLLFAHVPVCVLRPLSLDIFPVHMSTSLFETPLRVLSPESLIYAKSSLHRPFASTLRFSEKQHGPKHEPPRDVGGASNCVSAHRGNPFPRGIVSLICCGEMPKREKISPTFMPDFLLPTWSECTKKEPLNVHYSPSTLGEAIRKLSFCSR